MIRTGSDYLASLKDGRTVYIDGTEVNDVIDHPAFRNAIRSYAAMYDFQAAPENVELMTFEVAPGRRVNRSWQLPTSYQELVQRRRAIEAWSALNCGWLGRSPDHLASCLGGMMMGIEVFERNAPARAAALRDYVRHARDNDLFVSYVIQNPQADRAAGASQQPNPDLVAGVVDEDSGGITVRGAKMLGTSSIMSNEIFAANINPLKAGEERYALSFALPIGTRGVKLMSRRSYEAHSGAVFDYPLSAHFDENDAVVFFDDVRVPWERVFVCKDIAMAHAQWHETPAHVFQNYQSQIRLAVKLHFLVGVARRIAETNGTVDMPPVRSALGLLAAQATMVEGLVSGMEAQGEQRGRYFVPSRQLLYAAQVVTQELYPQFINAVRELAGGGTIMLPSSAADFGNAEIRRIIERTILSPATDSEGRVRLFRLAWDAIGSEFASRHVQYEMFYAGASFVTRGNAYRTYEWAPALAMVDRILAQQGTVTSSHVERAA